MFEKTVEVDTYELPMFTANIAVPEYVAITDGSFPVRVNIDYTFGRTMHGVAVVRFKRFSHLVIFEKTLVIGRESGIFDVDIANDLGVDGEESIDIVLDFTDSMSDKKINACAFTTIRNLSTVLTLEALESFKRDQTFEIKISAMRYDGAPVVKLSKKISTTDRIFS